MQNLDRTGTYLKYFGRKQDTVYIKNLLISIKLRWKKLVRRADEKGRLLQQAYKEDKRVGALSLNKCCDRGQWHGLTSSYLSLKLCMAKWLCAEPRYPDCHKKRKKKKMNAVCNALYFRICLEHVKTVHGHQNYTGWYKTMIHYSWI